MFMIYYKMVNEIQGLRGLVSKSLVGVLVLFGNSSLAQEPANISRSPEYPEMPLTYKPREKTVYEPALRYKHVEGPSKIIYNLGDLVPDKERYVPVIITPDRCIPLAKLAENVGLENIVIEFQKFPIKLPPVERKVCEGVDFRGWRASLESPDYKGYVTHYVDGVRPDDPKINVPTEQRGFLKKLLENGKSILSERNQKKVFPKAQTPVKAYPYQTLPGFLNSPTNEVGPRLF